MQLSCDSASPMCVTLRRRVIPIFCQHGRVQWKVGSQHVERFAVRWVLQ